jgi:hypothetical protein
VDIKHPDFCESDSPINNDKNKINVAAISTPQILHAVTFWKWVRPTWEGFWRDANV